MAAGSTPIGGLVGGVPGPVENGNGVDAGDRDDLVEDRRAATSR